MWTDTIASVTDLLGALAALLVALAGVGLGVKKLTGRDTTNEPATVVAGDAVPAAFDYEAEWRYERKRNDRLVERSDRLELRVTTLETYVNKLEALLIRNNIPF